MSRQGATRQLPIFKKAEAIVRLTEGLVALFPEENELLQSIKGMMYGDALLIPAKIVGAEAGDLYDLRMENAAIIRKAARELYVNAGSLKYHGIDNTEYANLLRKEIDDFRYLFIDWVAGFDQNNYIRDDWGLFNPPGIVALKKGEVDDDDFDIDDRNDFDDEEE